MLQLLVKITFDMMQQMLIINNFKNVEMYPRFTDTPHHGAAFKNIEPEQT